MLGIDEIKPMREEMQKRVWLLNGLELGVGRFIATPPGPDKRVAGLGYHYPHQAFDA
jgi:hypothetical protein